ncbi:metalloprotease family protein [Salinibaculum rarum]|uniref:metalloprotease family protein n=1 Tax=Salinibaculum rarum TaxID=3058903 RepID=UPI00265D9E23|nr:metalloprotease family protein [Salinibaculum sp. KK48]
MVFESIKQSRLLYYLQYVNYHFRVVLTTVTFIGVVFHEFAHKKFCQRYHIPVSKVVYFQFDTPAGYVNHAKPKYYRAMFFIAIAPFLINSTLAYGVFYTLAVYHRFFTAPSLTWPPSPGLIIFGLMVWFGVSLSLHAFPSRQDASEVWSHTKAAWTRNPFVLLGVPVIALIVLLNKFKIIGIDFLYTAALVVGAYMATQALPV